MTDLPRLQATLGTTELAWLVRRLQQRLERGEALQGSVTLRDASAQQRAAVDRLLGRHASRGTSLTVRLDHLEAVLRHGELCDSLAEAIEVLTGPVKNLRAEQARRDEQWAALFRQAEGCLRGHETLRRWLDDLRASGLLLRLSGRNVRSAQNLLDQAIAVVTRLPVADVPLAELAAEATGNAHSLDAGQPLATIVLRAVTALSGIEELSDAQARRDAWASVGVVCDELSASVLTLNLRADVTSLTGRVAESCAEYGEPCRLTVRQLLRHPPSFDPVRTGQTACVCENSTIVAAAADRLAAASAPLVCVEGEPNTAARVLLRQLAAADVRLAYHGDFDWKGIQIANLVMRRHGAVPWRFSTDDYLATSGGTTLQGSPVAASWDPHLQTAMSESGRAIHEEQVLEDLLADLATPPGKPAPH